MFNKALPLVAKLTTPKGLTYNQPLGLFINNEFVQPKSNKTFEVYSPSTGEKITDVYESLAEDVDIAVDAAKTAYDNGWASGAPEQRAKILFKLADLVEENLETLAQIETWDNGKSLQNARGDIGFTAAYFRSCGGWADKINGSQINTGSNYLTYTQRVPLISGQIIPWNASTLMASWKLGPVIATGGTTVLKPAEHTPLAVLYLAQLLVEAGIPKGVVNIVPGFGATTGAAIASHPNIDKVAFTGSTATGKVIMKLAADSNLKKVTLELGGKSPNIVFNDADLDKTVHNLVSGVFSNSGETCAAGARVLVQSGVYDEVVARFKEAAEAIKVGDPFEEETFMGSQVNEIQFSKILEFVELGKEQGATLVTGGERIGDKGYFIKPTIFADVKKDMTIFKEEIFGPVASVIKFDTIDEAIALANDSEYGLAAGVHTTNINTGLHVANNIKSGSVWVNTYSDLHPMVPFGGFKSSGIGREMGEESFKEYTEVRSVRVKLYPDA